MSTRCVVNFTYKQEIQAKVYRHSDGYPDGEHGVPADLERFFAAVEKDTKDTRFTDPTYLAAKFVVWQAGECARKYQADPKTGKFRWKRSKRLDFLGVGVVTEDPGDIEWIYTVDCSASREVLTRAGMAAKGRPVVTWKEAGCSCGTYKLDPSSPKSSLGTAVCPVHNEPAFSADHMMTDANVITISNVAALKASAKCLRGSRSLSNNERQEIADMLDAIAGGGT